MKKLRLFLLLFIAIIILWPVPIFAAWSIQFVNPATGRIYGNYAAFGITFTSDGSAMSATDIIAKIAHIELKSKVQGSTLYRMAVSPGTGGVAPNAAFNITLTNYWGLSIYTGTSIDHTADSWPDIITPMGVYPPILEELNVAFSDIGDSGDQVTLYFYFWTE